MTSQIQARGQTVGFSLLGDMSAPFKEYDSCWFLVLAVNVLGIFWSKYYSTAYISLR